ncbi:LDL receptor repeat-containing protein egg-1-like isoform X2 [Ptychodera flava]|uniref:LDL receptor repeat-containing protein egg-1-like isoform X2 n=2 Tax=Ptychodera flava TaxID=63121 RepID=UPI00396A83AE
MKRSDMLALELVFVLYVLLVSICSAINGNVIQGNLKTDQDTTPRYCKEYFDAFNTSQRVSDSNKLPFSYGMWFTILSGKWSCTDDGRFEPLQCPYPTGYFCACVSPFGNIISRTITAKNEATPICTNLKVGHCPVTKGDVSICSLPCFDDADCPNSLKCCEANCGRTCLEPKQECLLDEFTCTDGIQCVNTKYICDGIADCVDASDERNCGEQFECKFGRRIPMSFRCNGIYDCVDRTDEDDCESYVHPLYCGDEGAGENCNCKSEFKKCPTGECVPSYGSDIMCDGYVACSDGSDEQDCDLVSCSNGMLIQRDDFCDRKNDCGDGSDEKNCDYNLMCQDLQYRCDNNDCVEIFGVCDGYIECSDGSDEMNCPCDFRCDDGTCLDQNEVCDGFPECNDGSDEEGCDPKPCEDYQETCDNGECVFDFELCDGRDDCGDNSDEADCSHYICQDGEDIGIGKYKCDRRKDCQDGSDESECDCWDSEFRCDDVCKPSYVQCDGNTDCHDERDEMNCETYRCDDGQVMRFPPGRSVNVRCNRWAQCNDGSDEKDCPCDSEYEFLCADGECKSSYVRCNGYDECVDGSDETDCPKHVCDNGEEVLLQWKTRVECDEEVDCDDKSDEINCPCHLAYHYKCPNGLCLQRETYCNGYNDCGDNFDETNCGPE